MKAGQTFCFRSIVLKIPFGSKLELLIRNTKRSNYIGSYYIDLWSLKSIAFW